MLKYSAVLAALILMVSLVAGAFSPVQAACNGSMVVVLPQEQVTFIIIPQTLNQRVMQVSQGGEPPVWYDVYWCQCEHGNHCQLKQGSASEPGNPPSSQGCTLLGGPGSYHCRIAASGGCTP